MSRVRLFMVPIYIEVEEGHNHGVALALACRYLEDCHTNIYTDTQYMIDCGEQHGDDIPEELRNE